MFFDTCPRTSRTPKFWRTYGDFLNRIFEFWGVNPPPLPHFQVYWPFKLPIQTNPHTLLAFCKTVYPPFVYGGGGGVRTMKNENMTESQKKKKKKKKKKKSVNYVQTQ